MFQTRKEEVRKDILRLAVKHTAIKRGSLEELTEYKEICEEIREEEALRKLWNNYIAENAYALHLQFEDVVENVLAVGRFIEE